MKSKIGHITLSCCIGLLLCTVFAMNPYIEDGLLMGKFFWFHTTVFSLAIFNFISVVWIKWYKRPTFDWADGLVLLFALLTLLTYKWTLNPDPEKLLFIGQCVILWFLLKTISSQWENFARLSFTVIIVVGIVEALCGVCQLYGLIESHHPQFKLVGTFYNPGPFSGYLAVILPLSVDLILQYRKTSLRGKQSYLYYAAWIYCVLAIILLPAGMSRTAWIAALVSCGWVYWQRKVEYKVIKSYICRFRLRVLIISIIGLGLVTSLVVGAYWLKKDSADGRLLLWKITEKIIMQHPWTGTGLGGFRSAYAETQMRYFSSGDATETEQKVAELPNFAFNDMMQIGAEQGIATMVIFASLVGFTIYRGYRNRQIGTVGSIISFAIFSMASYPLHFPEFWSLLIVLFMIAHYKHSKISVSCKQTKGVMAFSFILVIACLTCFYPAIQYYSHYKEWRLAKVLHNNGQYMQCDKLYRNLAEQLRHRPELLSEVALCESKNQQHTKANILLYRAMALCADPEYYYIAAQNEQKLGNYVQAERLLKQISQMLPNRIYPYYLLAKLYACSEYRHPDKLEEMKRIVLTKKPKVMSTAIRQMREEVESLE